MTEVSDKMPKCAICGSGYRLDPCPAEGGVPSGLTTEDGEEMPLFQSKPRKVFAVQHDGTFASAQKIQALVNTHGGHAELVPLMAYKDPQLRVRVKEPNHYLKNRAPWSVWVEKGCWVVRDEEHHDEWEMLSNEDFKARFFKVVQ